MVLLLRGEFWPDCFQRTTLVQVSARQNHHMAVFGRPLHCLIDCWVYPYRVALAQALELNRALL